MTLACGSFGIAFGFGGSEVVPAGDDGDAFLAGAGGGGVGGHHGSGAASGLGGGGITFFAIFAVGGTNLLCGDGHGQ